VRFASVQRPFALAAFIGAIATATLSASSAGVRYVTVVNLASAPATAVLVQHGAVATKTIASHYDHTFDIPPGTTTLLVTSAVCSGEKRLALPTQEKVRVVINTGCALSIQ
jgi:hypothetical protein